MELTSLSIVSTITFILVILTLVFAFTKSDEKVKYWSGLVILLFLAIMLAWWSDDLALQWVFIEATTLIVALLVSMSRTEKSIEVAWKFLLLNSFGLSLAFLGLIILSFGIHSQVTTNINDILNQVSSHQTVLVETGMWLAIFGYSAKLGLFPNHFWVSDTYAESPSQISSIVSSLLPPAVCIALRPLVKMDYQFTSEHFSSSSGLLILGMLTMLYSLWTVFQTNDIRRITAQIALFHSGGLAIFVFLNPPDTIFYFILAANVTVKALLFSAMGIFRIDAGTRKLTDIKPDQGLNKMSTTLYVISVGMAFVIPFSPFFVMDMLFLKLGLQATKYWIIAVPIFSLIFFLVVFNKILPVLNIESRRLLPEYEKVLKIRMAFTIMILILSVCVGLYGIFLFANGGFTNV